MNNMAHTMPYPGARISVQGADLVPSISRKLERRKALASFCQRMFHLDRAHEIQLLVERVRSPEILASGTNERLGN
jgi:hypothetical protein